MPREDVDGPSLAEHVEAVLELDEPVKTREHPDREVNEGGVHRIGEAIPKSAAEPDLHPNVRPERAGDALQGPNGHPGQVAQLSARVGRLTDPRLVSDRLLRQTLMQPDGSENASNASRVHAGEHAEGLSSNTYFSFTFEAHRK